jgi:hypothetical protein
MNNSTHDRTDYAKDWRGRCVACEAETTQAEMACPMCRNEGTLAYRKDSHSVQRGNYKKCWFECGWECTNDGSRLKNLLCPHCGEGIIPLAKTEALVRSGGRAFLVQLAGFLAFYALLLPFGSLCESTGNKDLIVIPFAAAIALWVYVVKRLKHWKLSWQTYRA